MIDDATIGQRLQAARHALGLTQGDVGKAMQLGISTISEIEAGKRSVSGAELHALARLYHRPIAFFLEEEAQESPGFQYLFREADAQILDRAAIVTVDELARDYAHLEELVGIAPLPMPPDYSGFGFHTDQDAESLAEMERGRLGLGEAPVKDLMNLLDATVGVRTFAVPVERQSWSALVARDSTGRPCIAVNSKEEGYRRNFDLAHDYAHVLVHLGKQGLPAGHIDVRIAEDIRPADERFANAFASAFLMPRRAVLSQLEQILSANSGRFTDVDLVHLAMHFGVSGQALSLRLVALRKLSRQVYVDYWKRRSFKDIAAALGYEVEDFSLEPVLPARFRYVALKAYEDGQISLAKLAQLLRKSYYELAERLCRAGRAVSGSELVG